MNAKHYSIGPRAVPKLDAALRTRAFTLIELLVVVALIGVGALMLSPALASTRFSAKSLTCKSNMKQLTAGWMIYASDNNDRLAINGDPHHPSPGYPVSWVAGILDWTAASDNTNTTWLSDGRAALLGPYVANSIKVFWCPADTYLSSPQRAAGWANRVRSVSMDAAVGDGPKYAGFSWMTYVARKNSDFAAPGPSESWVFTDEHPDAIDDAVLYSNPGSTNGTGLFVELPASNHTGGSGMGFADGHAEVHNWRDARTLRPVVYSGGAADNISVVNSPDLAWLAKHTPRQP
jgi:prepilin-type N-terminal cleavage/methylation domain-containing protein/prepilin-type processing-associated H-X9-DG protein